MYNNEFLNVLGKFNVLFEWKPSVAFGRLVYSVYLVHFIFQMFHSATRREYSFDPMIINEVSYKSVHKYEHR